MKYITLSGSSLNYINSIYYKYNYINDKISFTNGLFIIFFDKIWKLSYKKNETHGEIIYYSKKGLMGMWESIKNKDNILIKTIEDFNTDNIEFIGDVKFFVDEKIGVEKSNRLIINYCLDGKCIKTYLYYENIFLKNFFNNIENFKKQELDLFLWVYDNKNWNKLEKINTNILNKKLDFNSYSISKNYPVFRYIENNKIYLSNNQNLNYKIVRYNSNYAIKLLDNFSYDFFFINIYKLEKDTYNLHNLLVISKKNFVDNVSTIYLDDGIYYFKCWIADKYNIILSKEICYPENKKFIVNTKIHEYFILDIINDKFYLNNTYLEVLNLPKNKNIMLNTSCLLTIVDISEFRKNKDYILLKKNNKTVCLLTDNNKLINRIFISTYMSDDNLSINFLTKSNKKINLKIKIIENLSEDDFLEEDYFKEEPKKDFNNFKVKIKSSYNNIRVTNLKSKFIIGNGSNLKNVKGEEGTIYSIVTNDGFEKTKILDKGSLLLKKDVLLANSKTTQHIKNDLQLKSLECDNIYLNSLKINGKILNDINLKYNSISNLTSISNTDAANKKNLVSKIINMTESILNTINFDNNKIKNNIDCNFKRIKNIPDNKCLINKEFLDSNSPKFGLGLELENNILKNSLSIKIDKSKSGISLKKDGLYLNNDFSKQDFILSECKFYELNSIKKSGGLVFINNYVTNLNQKLINSGNHEGEGTGKLLVMSDSINNSWVSNKIIKTCMSKNINIVFGDKDSMTINNSKLITNKINMNLGINRIYIIKSNRKINFKFNNLEFLDILKDANYILDTKNMRLSDNIQIIHDNKIIINLLIKDYCSKY